MNKLIALCDYQGRFGSKYFDTPYRSGMDKALLTKAFSDQGVTIEYRSMADSELLESSCNKHVIYTSQEDAGYVYKSYVEDVVLGLELSGAHPIPHYKYLRANNNKVFMEMLRKIMLADKYQISTRCYGAAEEAMVDIDTFSYPTVIKSSHGAGSHGVKLARDKREFIKIVHAISRSQCIQAEARDRIRALRHKGYIRESLYRTKFIVQGVYGSVVNLLIMQTGLRYSSARYRNALNYGDKTSSHLST